MHAGIAGDIPYGTTNSKHAGNGSGKQITVHDFLLNRCIVLFAFRYRERYTLFDNASEEKFRIFLFFLRVIFEREEVLHGIRPCRIKHERPRFEPKP